MTNQLKFIGCLLLFANLSLKAEVKIENLKGCEEPGIECALALLDKFDGGQLSEESPVAKEWIRSMWDYTLYGTKEFNEGDLDCTDDNYCPNNWRTQIVRSGARKYLGGNYPAYGGNPFKSYTSVSERADYYIKQNEAWSGAFICASYLRCSEKKVDGDWHGDYIKAMIEHPVLSLDWGVYFAPIALKAGDLLCNERTSPYEKSSHCDIVLNTYCEGGQKVALVIGGNKDRNNVDSVRTEKILLTAEGKPIMGLMSLPFDIPDLIKPKKPVWATARSFTYSHKYRSRNQQSCQ